MNSKKSFYNLEINKLLVELGLPEEALKSGLAKKEIKKSIEKYGRNVLVEKKKKSKTRVFLEQFQDILVIILIVAAIISLFTGQIESSIVIFIVLLFNAILGTTQIFKAEKSLSSLKKLSSITTTVLRDNKEFQIPSNEVVVGDIILIKSGDIVPADARIIKANFLEVDESSLTGEATPVNKIEDAIAQENIGIASRKNMVFSGTSVNSGDGACVVVNVGMNTEIGKIALLIEETNAIKTPLQKSLDEFSKKLAIVIMIICLAVFVINLYRNMTFFDSLMFAVALAVAAIPEALSSIVIIVLAIGTQKMAIEKAVVKELKAVEGLGCVNVICTDKTGTLTENNMKVESINKINNKEEVINISNKHDLYLLSVCILCNDANMSNINIFDENVKISSTEIALLRFCNNYLNIFDFQEKHKRLDVIPFSSKRKMMYTLNSFNNTNLLLVKGAGEVVLNKSKYIFDGNLNVLHDYKKNEILDEINQMAQKGLRVLGLAYKEYGKDKEKINSNDENNLIFLGLVGLIDPPRKDVRAAIIETMKAGIRPIMITGDHETTAVAIGKKVGITSNNSITGEKIDKLSDDELEKVIESTNIFARVSPENKIRIVSLLQKNNNIVAFIGDGVNDAPALKKSNIGISMGKGGTEVSKDASSIILMDDNYSTIVKAIKNGRNIYDNIQNAIRFLISGNIAGILAVMYTSLLNLPIPFAPVHLLFINLLTDSLPAIAIGMEDSKVDLSKQKPRKPKEFLLSKRVLRRVLVEGALIFASTITAYTIGLNQSPYAARTCAFLTLCTARLFHSFNCRGSESIIKRKIDNKFMLFSFFLGIILVNLVMFVPYLQNMLKVEPLNIEFVKAIFLLAILPTLIIQSFMIIMETIRSFKFKKNKI